MKRFFRRLRTCLFFLIVVLCIVPAILLYLYTSHGGELKDVPDLLPVWIDTTRDALDKGQEKADEALEWARETSESLRDAIPERPDWTQSTAAPDSGQPIAVFFSPPVDRSTRGAHEAFLGLIESARESVLCAFYELDYGPAADALIARHKAGIRVGIVSDSDYEDEEPMQACITAGIPVVFDERGAFMHDKFCVVDGRWVWTGSTNITDNGFFRNNNNALLMESATLAELYADEFDEMFTDRRFGGASPSGAPYPPVRIGTAEVAVIFTPDDGARARIVKEIRSAKTSVDFAAFAFTAADIADALVDRARQSVRVRGIFEGRNAESSYSKDEFLLKNGVAVYNDTNPGAMHHKFILIDKSVVITGSYNFSNAAEDKNDENVVIIRSDAVAQAFADEFDRLILEWARPRSVGN